MSRIRTVVVVLALAIPIPAAVAGCGGGSSSNSEDPQQVLDQTFNNPTTITSGNLAISVDGSVQGAQSGDFSATISGPFQSDPNDKTAIPQLDLTAKVSASGAGQTFSFDGALIATKDNAYVEYQNQAYEVGTDAFKQFAAAYAKSAKQAQAQQGSQDTSSLFKRFGIDPSSWLTNITNEGTTDVEGESTIHIHGDADVAKIVSDLQTISQATAGATAQQLTPDQLNQAKDAIQNASIDVYSGTDDHLLRKLAVTLTIAPPASAGSTVSSVDLTFSVTLTDVNSPQTISAPANAKPLSDLLSQFGLGGTIPGLGGAPTLAPPGGSATPPGGGTSPAYLKCVQQAKSIDQINACAQKQQ